MQEEERHDEGEEASRARSGDESAEAESAETESSAEGKTMNPAESSGTREPALAGAGGEHSGRSQVDAMGLDKHRAVIGQTYGPTRARQLAVFAIFFACVGALFIGGKLLADKLDEPPKTIQDKAPWSRPDAPQRPAVRPQ